MFHFLRKKRFLPKFVPFCWISNSSNPGSQKSLLSLLFDPAIINEVVLCGVGWNFGVRELDLEVGLSRMIVGEG